jgi:hypothetical protein
MSLATCIVTMVQVLGYDRLREEDASISKTEEHKLVTTILPAVVTKNIITLLEFFYSSPLHFLDVFHML